MKTKTIILIILIIYLFFSVINITSFDPSYLPRQLIWYGIGILSMFFIDKITNKKIIRSTFIIYVLLNLLLLYLLLFGTPINGSKAWLNLGFMSFQPSEFMKVILIILLSIIISTHEKYFMKCLIITLIPSILTFLEPDTGNVIFYFVIFLSAIFYKIKNIKPVLIFMISSLISLTFFFLFYHFKQNLFISLFGTSFFYRMDRLSAFTNNSSYQLNNALIGMGNSSLFGKFPHIGIYIPEAITDFAFSLLISNIGFIGISIFLIINISFNIILIRLYNHSMGVMKSIIFIFLIMKIIQESIHEFMNVGLFPITGITLPFISYGGSSLISYFLILGLILSNHMDMDHRGYNMDLD